MHREGRAQDGEANSSRVIDVEQRELGVYLRYENYYKPGLVTAMPMKYSTHLEIFDCLSRTYQAPESVSRPTYQR